MIAHMRVTRSTAQIAPFKKHERELKFGWPWQTVLWDLKRVRQLFSQLSTSLILSCICQKLTQLQLTASTKPSLISYLVLVITYHITLGFFFGFRWPSS